MLFMEGKIKETESAEKLTKQRRSFSPTCISATQLYETMLPKNSVRISLAIKI